MTYLRAYAGTIAGFLLVDLVWISQVAGPLYKDEIGDMLLAQPKALAALLFYVAYAAAIVLLAVRPALQAASPRRAAADGAVLGLAAYGAFTLTNYAALTGWTMTLVVTDILWGGFITGLAALAGYFAAGRAARAQ